MTSEQLAHVDIARMNLLCSVGLPGVDPFDIDEYLHRLSQWALRIAMRTKRWRHIFSNNARKFEYSEPLWRMFCLSKVLTKEARIRYVYDERYSPDADWTQADRHLLHGLLGPKRHGTCSSLPVLVVAVGRRLGYPMKLVHSPGHVFSRWDGDGHKRKKWAERRNIEFNGDDFDSYPDSRYLHEPIEWSAEMIDLEQRRTTKLYLRSLTPAEELASFVVQRGYAFEAHKMFPEAWDCFLKASRLAPHDDSYRFFAQDCNRKHLDHILKPWGMNAKRYDKSIDIRFRGGHCPFPWEDAHGNLLTPNFPITNPRDIAALRSVHKVVYDRLKSAGKTIVNPNPDPHCRPIGFSPSPQFQGGHYGL